MKEVNTSGQYGKKPDAPPVDPMRFRIAEIRAYICESCEYVGSVTRPKIVASRFAVSTVRCDKCGCGGLNLLSDKSPCPIGRHSE